MKKLIALSLILLLAFVTPLFASVGIVVDGSNQGVATDLEFSDAGSTLTNNGSRWTFNLLLAGVGNGGATSMTTSDSAVSTSAAFVRKAIAADSAFNTGTLGDGKPGQLLTIYITEDLGSVTWTLTPTTSTHIETVDFDAVGDSATFLYVNDTYGWALVSHENVTIVLSDGQ